MNRAGGGEIGAAREPRAPGPGALDGILVVDLSRVLAGPYCTMILGDLGARILKIESPGSGDDTRLWGPPFVGGESAYFLSVNRNKESVTLNLKHPAGADILWRLIDKADVLVENFRPGTLARLGFGYEECAARRPELVYASVSGYGQTGPESGRPGYDLIAQGEGGMMGLTGDPDGPPFKAGMSQADVVAGMWALSGILAALLVRQRTGRGQRVDAALLDGQVGLLAYHATNYFATGKAPARKGNRHPSITPYESFATRDGWLNVAVGNDGQWRTFCRVLEHPGLADDPRFVRNADRVGHREELEKILGEHFRARTTAAWLELFRAAGIPAGAVQDLAELLESPQIRARGMVVEVDHPTAGRFPLIGTPVRLSDTPGLPRRPPPLLGEHTESVLAELLGFTPGIVENLRSQGVV